MLSFPVAGINVALGLKTTTTEIKKHTDHKAALLCKQIQKEHNIFLKKYMTLQLLSDKTLFGFFKLLQFPLSSFTGIYKSPQTFLFRDDLMGSSAGWAVKCWTELLLNSYHFLFLQII